MGLGGGGGGGGVDGGREIEWRCDITPRPNTHRIRLPSLTIVQQHPVVHPVLDLTRVLQCLGEEISEEIVIWSLFEAEFTDVVEVDGEFLFMMRLRDC